MAATNAYVNSGGWQFATGSSTLSITRVKDWSLNRGVSRLRESADYDHYNTLNVCDHEDPTITLSTLDAFAHANIDASEVGTLTGIVRDANNGATTGGGAKQITLNNAVLMDANASGAHRQYARGSIGFCGTSTDGATSPLAISAI